MENSQQKSHLSSFASHPSISILTSPSKTIRETLYTRVSDESFVEMERNCSREVEFENLMAGMGKRDLNDTLDEIDFILEMGRQLKEREESMKKSLNKDSAISSTIGESLLENESEIVHESMEETFEDSVVEVREEIEEILIEDSVIESTVVEDDSVIWID